MTVTVYLAAPYEMIDYAQHLRVDLYARDFTVCARWIDSEPASDDWSRDEWARNDLADIDAADVVVVLSNEEYRSRGTGGRHTELGYAIGTSKPIILFGPRTQIFHYLTFITAVDDPPALYAALDTFRR